MQCISLFKRVLILLYESFLLLAVYVVVGAPVTFFFKVVYNPKASLFQQPNYLLYVLFILCVFYLYFSFCWVRGGQTLAIKSWRCKVVNEAGENISYRQALIRYLTGAVSLLFFGGGFLLSLFRKDNATLHDLVSKSYLIKLPKKI